MIFFGDCGYQRSVSLPESPQIILMVMTTRPRNRQGSDAEERQLKHYEVIFVKRNTSFDVDMETTKFAEVSAGMQAAFFYIDRGKDRADNGIAALRNMKILSNTEITEPKINGVRYLWFWSLNPDQKSLQRV